MIKLIHGKKYYSQRMYCNGMVLLTPEKEPMVGAVPVLDTTPVTGPEVELVQEGATAKNEEFERGIYSVPTLISPLPSPNWPTFDNEDLSRRKSLSLFNQTPHQDSLAAELLGINRQNSQSLISHIRDLAESLSDFNSCVSFSNSEGSDNEAQPNRREVKKRKRKKTPIKEELAKKANLKVSPEKIPGPS